MGSGQGPNVDTGYQRMREGETKREISIGRYWEDKLKHRDTDFSEKGKVHVVTILFGILWFRTSGWNSCLVW